MKDKGFMRGVFSVVMFWAVIIAVLAHSNFTFDGPKIWEKAKPVWETIVDKTVDVGTKIAKVII